MIDRTNPNNPHFVGPIEVPEPPDIEGQMNVFEDTTDIDPEEVTAETDKGVSLDYVPINPGEFNRALKLAKVYEEDPKYGIARYIK